MTGGIIRFKALLYLGLQRRDQGETIYPPAPVRPRRRNDTVNRGKSVTRNLSVEIEQNCSMEL
jgi:hypothetical protein